MYKIPIKNKYLAYGQLNKPQYINSSQGSNSKDMNFLKHHIALVKRRHRQIQANTIKEGVNN